MALVILTSVLATCILFQCTFAVTNNNNNGNNNALPSILLGTERDIRLLDGSRKQYSTVVKSIYPQGVVFDYNIEKNIVCWIDNKLETLQCRKINSTDYKNDNYVLVNSSYAQPVGLACDWITNKLYWTDSEKHRIEVIDLSPLITVPASQLSLSSSASSIVNNEQHRKISKVLFWTDISSPRSIALSPIDGIIFWSSWGGSPRIEKASMNGDKKTRKIIVTTNVETPNSLVIDYDNKLLYWVDQHTKSMNSVDYDGKNRKTISKDGSLPYSITFFNNKLYWCDWQSHNIYSMNITTLATTIVHQRDYPRDYQITDYLLNDIKVYDEKRQPFIDHPCRHNNGNCSHICLISMDTLPGYTCECPTGVKLINDTTCENRANNIVLIVQKHKIIKVSLDTNDYTVSVLPFAGIKHAIAIDFDPVEEMVYWTDDVARSIKRAYLNGTGQQDIIKFDVVHPDGIAVDWIARNFYWSDTGTNRIEVARLNGTSRKVIIDKNLVKPRAISLAPQLGWMFWTDWYEKHPKIERSNLDGSGRKILISKDIKWPNGIALDIEKQKLYWSDASYDKIEVCNMDGTDRKLIINDNLPHIFGLTILSDYLYWTDWQSRSIDRAHKLTGLNRTTIVNQASDVMGIKAIQLGHVDGTNPCAINNGGCSHLCLNKYNNEYICACQMGQELAVNNKTCIVPDAFLLFSKKQTIGRLSIEHPIPDNDDIIPIDGIKEASSLDFDIAMNKIYWSDATLGSISRAFINGTDVEQVVELGLKSPDSLAIDWISHNIYWADLETKRIELMKIDAGYRKIIIWENLINPRFLIVDPIHGFIYWSELSDTDKGFIARSKLDGTSREIVVSNTGKTQGLTIDHANEKLYWGDLYISAIDSYDIKSGKRKTVVTQGIVYPYSLTQYLDYIFWTDWNTNTIEKAHKITGLNRTKVYNRIKDVTGIIVFHESRQSGTNPCAINNGGCSHICISFNDTLNKYKCLCSTHYILANDEKTCIPPINFMIFSTKNQISRLLPDSNDCPDVVLRDKGMKNIQSIEYDPVTQSYYWIDNKMLRKTYENRSQVIIPSKKGFHPFDIAIDPIGRLLFVSCSGYNTINVTNMDNSMELGVVVDSEKSKPRHIAVHSEKRLLFWTDIENKTVMRSLFDGNNKTVIVNKLNEVVSLTIDTVNNVIYWADGRKIESSDINGKNRREIITLDLYDSIEYMTVLYDYIYWFNRHNHYIERIIKTNGNLRKKIVKNTLSISSLSVVQTPNDEILEQHPCSPLRNHGDCSHFCLINSTTMEAQCSCPNYLVLSDDNVTCSALPSCGAGLFTCATMKLNDRCISDTWKCDGTADCSDHSDELGCSEYCKNDQFRCNNGQCIDSSMVCNGEVECHDGSDEAICCKRHEFRCKVTNVCILREKLCDLWEDCADNTDETDEECSRKDSTTVENHQIPSENLKISYIILILVSFFIVIIIFLSCCYCCRKKYSGEELPDILHDSAGDPLQRTGRINKPLLHTKNGNSSNNSKTFKTNFKNIKMSTLSSSTIDCSSYDRSHITGASNSTKGGSSGGSYPHETLNPPPSPATTANSTRCSSSNASRYKPYKNYRTINQPPPPTPCSTDVCDESDSNYHPSRYRYESQTFPPPPTPAPRSNNNSEAGNSCPPSPGSRSSTYFSPLPPPPSPVPQ